MDRRQVQAWLDRYVEAWRTNDPEQIGALFTDDAVYRYRPYDEARNAVRGLSPIVENWLEEQDPPGSWEAHYEPFAVDGDRAVATGTSRYLASAKGPARTYHNAFLLRFGPDGRCAEFTEYYMLEE
ncbi:MAG TPA: nuclear transport factor 2 family protein [candidate division Zixibacteria bacterium]|nr:nuclear transport factor 2 family protein [candidate division Zixibacteria bacterium]